MEKKYIVFEKENMRILGGTIENMKGIAFVYDIEDAGKAQRKLSTLTKQGKESIMAWAAFDHGSLVKVGKAWSKNIWTGNIFELARTERPEDAELGMRVEIKVTHWRNARIYDHEPAPFETNEVEYCFGAIVGMPDDGELVVSTDNGEVYKTGTNPWAKDSTVDWTISFVGDIYPGPERYSVEVGKEMTFIANGERTCFKHGGDRKRYYNKEVAERDYKNIKAGFQALSKIRDHASFSEKTKWRPIGVGTSTQNFEYKETADDSTGLWVEVIFDKDF